MLYALSEALLSIRDFMEQGGTVLWLIAILVFFMWGMIFERIWYLSHGHNSYIDKLANQWNSRKDKTSWYALQVREKLISQAKFEINKNLSMIQTCIMLAPLFGLLGTVTGMIEVFQVMAFSGGGDARAMAGGVSKATLPTMAGMVVALSGVFASIYLNSASTRHESNLDEIIKREF
ncbi:MAG: TonB system transport protein ExbB2 [SAR86 cluster bacterium SAR86B]|mgnify:CR=1 FL=1|jgi:biopolymer transport protein ExbB|uniref:TonB system transport protein ExbB2 n=1 Tax=SAR86 cluster bacterium SAR86B TaxID=1123867 RepID=J4V609_9GAMM|nr:MAG: TonB system transport protein ExbB2 [SAR86 cluster bacterium SAR86B]|tara:strand:- start:643 stop:1173 length:531 start_codon:yes stop_codon:yes gene_type:complete